MREIHCRTSMFVEILVVAPLARRKDAAPALSQVGDYVWHRHTRRAWVQIVV